MNSIFTCEKRRKCFFFFFIELLPRFAEYYMGKSLIQRRWKGLKWMIFLFDFTKHNLTKSALQICTQL